MGRRVFRLLAPFLRSVLERLELLESGQTALRQELADGLAARDAELKGLAERLSATCRGTADSFETRLEELRQAYLATRNEFEDVRDRRVPQVERGNDTLQRGFEQLQLEVIELRDRAAAAFTRDLESLHAGLVAVQQELESLRDRRLPRSEHDLRAASEALRTLQATVEELRDQRLPALARSWEATTWRLHEDLEVSRGLLDRLLAGEPLRVTAVSGRAPDAMPEAVRQASAAMVDSLRGPRAEIALRAAETVEFLRGFPPVADLGCGRGELLEALQSLGVEAVGVDADPAMVAACRHRGLAVESGEALAWLQSRASGSLGAVAAIHLLEHLPAETWTAVLAESVRCLRPGGVLVVECPNPDSLRVGSGLFWSDPTHIRPIHPDSLTLVLRALGVVVEPPRYRRPFPPDQMLAREGQSTELYQMAEKLDAVLSGPRDFLLAATKPNHP